MTRPPSTSRPSEDAEGDLVRRAKVFATQAHRRIDQRRKYTHQPYDVHLKAVAELVGGVTEDAETIAAAWLHDTVEDTPATFQDVEREFGTGVAELVVQLTEVSRRTDGNRARRKEIDREHLATASPRAKTIKLADLIDNGEDIARNDPRFARTYLAEMAALLEVLEEGDETLLAQARSLLEEASQRVGIPPPTGSFVPVPVRPEPRPSDPLQGRALRLFIEAFTARDIAEPLRSFDAVRPAVEVGAVLRGAGLSAAGLRTGGMVQGYVRTADLKDGPCASRMRPFGRAQVVEGDASLTEVIQVLTRHDHCFVAQLGVVSGVITRADVQKPIIRMWLFGMVTVIEMDLIGRIRDRWPEDGWVELVPAARVERARRLQEERQRRDQRCDLLDCLQLSDKASVVLNDPETLAQYGFSTKRSAKRAIKELESLRNNLAHAQDIVTHDWPQIARMTRRIESLVHDS